MFIFYIGDIPGAQFTSTNGLEKNAKGTFCWAPLKTAVANTPYVFSIEVYDNVCPLPGKMIKNYMIYVRDSVDGVKVDIGPDLTDSLGSDSFPVAASLLNYTGQALIWSSSGDGIFSEQDGQSTYYFPGPLDRISCTYQLYLEAIDSTPCTGNSKLKDTLVVTQQLAYFDAGASQLFFPGDTLKLNPALDTSRAWTYYWEGLGDVWLEDPFLVYGRFSPGNFDIGNCSSLLVLHASGCDTLSDTLNAMRDFRPMDAGMDILSIKADSIILQAIPSVDYAQKGYWRTTGLGSFSDTNNPSSVYRLAKGDSAFCELTFIWQEVPLANCLVNADSMKVNIIFTGLFAGNDSTINIADTAYLFASPIIGPDWNGYWKTMGDGVFSDILDPKSTYIPGSQDKWSCRSYLIWNYPYPNCSTEADTMVLNYDYPFANAGPDQSLLYGDSLKLSANKTPLNAASYYWTSTGDGYFSDSLDEQAVYYPGPNDWISCGSRLIWNSPYSSCASRNDTLIWTRIPFVLNAGGKQQQFILDSIQLNADPIQGGRVPGWWTSTGDGYFSDTLNPSAIYYPAADEILNCQGKLYWNAPYSKCTPLVDSMVWEKLIVFIDAGIDQLVNLGDDIVLKAKSGANRVIWTTNGFGRFLDSSAKATLYYPDSLDFPLCSLKFYLRELDAACFLQQDSLEVIWQESGISLTGLDYEPCFMDSIHIRITGNKNAQLNWQTSGSGQFTQDQAGSWIYIPSGDDFKLAGIFISVIAKGYCFVEQDSLFLPIQARNQNITNAHTSGPVIVYPNPTPDWLTITSTCQLNIISADLYDMAGKHIQFWEIQELPFKISIESLAPEVYILRVKLEGGREFKIPVTKYVK